MTSTGPGCPFLTASLAISSLSANAETIPLVSGALLGVVAFFRGLFLLKNPRPKVKLDAAVKSQLSAVTLKAITPKYVSSESEQLMSNHPPEVEVIRLTPTNAEAKPTLRTQQGQIAAALLRAGIPSPASWSTPSDGSVAGVQVAEPSTKPANGSSRPIQALDLHVSTALRKELPVSQHPETSELGAFHWRPALMVWCGPILTLTCVYILLKHFGWL